MVENLGQITEDSCQYFTAEGWHFIHSSQQLYGSTHHDMFKTKHNFQLVPEMLYGNNTLHIASPTHNFVYSVSAKDML